MLEHCPASCEALQQQQQQQNQEEEGAAIDAAAGAGAVECVDKHPHCPQWAVLGECGVNIDVRNHCAKACGVCNSEESCIDNHVNCQFWADAGECKVRDVLRITCVCVLF
jgi:hypothetical protein